MSDELKVVGAIADATRSAYWEGVRAGVRRFAWWKDGVQYVGTCGSTLKRALEEINKEQDGG